MSAHDDIVCGREIISKVVDLLPKAERVDPNMTSTSFLLGRHVFRFTIVMGQGRMIYVHVVDGSVKGKRVIDLTSDSSCHEFVEYLTSRLRRR